MLRSNKEGTIILVEAGTALLLREQSNWLSPAPSQWLVVNQHNQITFGYFDSFRVKFKK